MGAAEQRGCISLPPASHGRGVKSIRDSSSLPLPSPVQATIDPTEMYERHRGELAAQLADRLREEAAGGEQNEFTARALATLSQRPDLCGAPARGGTKEARAGRGQRDPMAPPCMRTFPKTNKIKAEITESDSRLPPHSGTRAAPAARVDPRPRL